MSFQLADWFILLAGLALVGWLQYAKHQPNTTVVPQAAEPAVVPGIALAPKPETAKTPDDTYRPTVFGPAIRLAPPSLSQAFPAPALRNAYAQDFPKGNYFGAFAAGPYDAYGWSQGMASRNAARASALASCNEVAHGCTVIGEILPDVAETALATVNETLSFDQAEGFRVIKGGSGARAFARSSDGNWGSAQAKDAANALSAALADCRGYQAKSPILPPMPCEVVALWDH